MNCPHCATPNATSPTCRLCGLPTDAPADDAPLPGLETGRAAATQDAATARLPGLVTTEEALGDTRIPEEPAPAAEPVQCRRCGAAAGPGRFCERCGMTLRPMTHHTPDSGASPLCCLACGVANGPERRLCVACGQRL